jgi:ubiquinone/menaquinone biosynthesis C-methylase UbiE
MVAMPESQIRFDDGASYERMMGAWSLLAGEVFLDWLAPRSGLRWVDVGCGNGAFTELIVQRCAPAEVQGIDPSDAQIAYAQTRPGARGAEFRKGDAMALPFPQRTFDAAIMALVIFFVPDPAKGVAEMRRVVSPGGIIAAYAWDMLGGGFTLEPIHEELRAMGHRPVLPPSVEVSRMDALKHLWTSAGLDAVETREITVRRTFVDFEDFWGVSLVGATIRSILAEMPPDELARLKEKMRGRMKADATGRITYPAHANAIKGRVPK